MPDAWPEALQSLSDAVGVAARLHHLQQDYRAGRLGLLSGLSGGVKHEYVRHYAALDPYSPLLDASWMKLSECLPDALLRRSEWYNDFVLACGVRDIVGTRLFETPSYRVILACTSRSAARSHTEPAHPQHRDGTAAALGAIAHGKPGDPERRRI